ncbi:MAG TPA: hypothetical protein VNZ52_00515 [Candidatus Thermoplasmatota archaeon]|nr:hypothetical protein [Candidatus Thermoplasmatota archaeon]
MGGVGLPAPAASSALSSAVSRYRAYLDERRRQARASWGLSAAFLVIGLACTVWGVVLAFFGQLSAGVLASVVGTVDVLIGGTVLRFNRDANDRYDRASQDLATLQRYQVALENAVEESQRVPEPPKPEPPSQPAGGEVSRGRPNRGNPTG